MNTYARPAEGAKNQKLHQEPDQKIAAFGSSYMRLGVFSWRLIGWQDAFASKLAPTVGLGVFSKRLVGWQDAFASKPAPTFGLSAIS